MTNGYSSKKDKNDGLDMEGSVEHVKAFAYDYWTHNTDPYVELNCLMPNGIFIVFHSSKTATMREVKEDLWDESVQYPLHGMLRDAGSYRIVIVNVTSELEEIFDESKRLCDLKPFCAILKIKEKENDRAENIFNVQIGKLIGKGLHEFDALRNTEVNTFRATMKAVAEDISRNRRDHSWLQKMMYQFPLRLIYIPVENQLASPHSPIPRKLRNGEFSVIVHFEDTAHKAVFSVPAVSVPAHLVRLIIKRKASGFMKRRMKCDDFVLKALGKDEYIYGDYKLIEYSSIYEALTENRIPMLMLMAKTSVPLYPDLHLYEIPENIESPSPANSLSMRKKAKCVPSFEVRNKFCFEINFISNLNCHKSEIGIRAGLFHGGKPLCQPRCTEEIPSKDGAASFEENLVYDIDVADIPRMTKLCFTVYELSKSAKLNRMKRNRDHLNNCHTFPSDLTPVGWVNTTIFDFKGQLKTGSVSLYLWSVPEELQTDNMFHPLSTVVSNPDTKNSGAISVTFYSFCDKQVIYPTLEQTEKYAKAYCRFSVMTEEEIKTPQNRSLLQHVRNMNNQVKRCDLHEQERKNLWNMRYSIMKTDPQLITHVLDCIDWNNRREVLESISLLPLWPRVSPQKALELLDYTYPDQAVRSFAVRCLHGIPNDHLLLYLLQLVQAVKHECFLQNDLVEFLLDKGLHNQKIGHYLFWHLRSEMSTKYVDVRFGLILEAYCRGSPQHVYDLTRQLNFLQKLKTTNELVRKRKDKDKIKAFVRDYFQQTHCLDTFYSVCNPLEPSMRSKCIIVEKCRVMDSKAKPMWLVFENTDPRGELINIIFKNGDDLRQDMLTLQMLRIMDNLWKINGYDFRMNPYGAISTDNRVGLIEVVLGADTIANIQKEKGLFSATSAFRKGSILAWLREHNPTNAALDRAIEEFTYSCAGYCVATFVLGVADRHSDNIMIKKTGQLFHIDFGHILGHFKEKFGFRRERVPFVLTHDFVHVINKGHSKNEVMEFQTFQKLCTDAFLILRKNGALILSLFAMMISTGLPELSSENDLRYLHESLVLHLSEYSAEKYFLSKFEEALSNSWKTSLNWASHNVSKNNK